MPPLYLDKAVTSITRLSHWVYQWYIMMHIILNFDKFIDLLLFTYSLSYAICKWVRVWFSHDWTPPSHKQLVNQDKFLWLL